MPDVSLRDMPDVQQMLYHQNGFLMSQGAAEVCHILQFVFDSYTASLDDSQDVGIILSAYGSDRPFRVDKVSAFGASLVFLQVFDFSTGQCCTILQHLSQLNFLLTSVPRLDPDQPRRRIGFSAVDPTDL